MHQNKDITSSYYLRLQQCFMRMRIYVICKYTLKYHWKISKTFTYLANIYICLFDWSYSSNSRIFHSFGDVTIAWKSCKFWPMLGTYGHWAVRVLQRATPIVTRDICLYICNGHLQGPVILTPIAESIAVKLSLPVFTTWIRCGCDSNTQPFACAKHNEICVRISTVISILYLIVLL